MERTEGGKIQLGRERWCTHKGLLGRIIVAWTELTCSVGQARHPKMKEGLVWPEKIPTMAEKSLIEKGFMERKEKSEREKERERVCVCVRERVCVSVCVCV